MRLPNLFLASFLFLILGSGKAQFTGKAFHPWIGQWEGKQVFLRYYPSAKVGTHVNEFSLNLSPSIIFQSRSSFVLQLKLTSSLRFNASYLGLPGGSIGSVNKASTIFSWGRPGETLVKSFFHQGFKRHNLEYYYMHYASTDMTHQFSGGLTYSLLYRKVLFQFSFENDFMAFLGLDEFRTGGGALDLKRVWGGKLYGVGLGALLWTGSTKGLTNLDFGQQYDMSRQFGADYSHGIVFLNLHYQGLTLRLGYDSEPIRMGIQDNLHRLINDGTIPGGSLRRNRVYLQLNILDVDFLY